MTSKGLLRAKACLTATTTAIIAGTAWGQASASQTITIKHGQTVESLAHHYNVAIKDILASNHLDADDVLRDGRSLYIPDAPRPQIVPGTMRKSARIHGDRISIRIGPASSQHRLRICDDGTKLVVTAEQMGWLQVQLPDGKIGWVRSDFIKYSGGKSTQNLANNTPRRQKDSTAPDMPAALPGGRERERAIAGRADRIARKHHEERHPLQVAAEHVRSAGGNSASSKRHLHEQTVARKRHERHLLEVAALNRHRKHLKEIASSHHHKSAAALAAHRRLHDENVAHARKLKHLHEIALAKRRHHAEVAYNGKFKDSHGKPLHGHALALAKAHEHHNEMLANYLHRQQVKLDRQKHHATLASSRHQSSNRYAHRIRPESGSPSASNDVVRSAFAYRGTPYRWGSSRPGGFDCSGFTKYIYGRKGVALPRTAAEQYHAGKAVGHRSMKPGDLVFFHTTRSGISHVGMYVGSGKFVHSSSSGSGGVRVDSLDSGYYNKAFRGARRVRKDASSEPSGE